jgi:hypothetical protein
MWLLIKKVPSTGILILHPIYQIPLSTKICWSFAILIQTSFYEVMGGKRDKMINTVCARFGYLKAKWINLESQKFKLVSPKKLYGKA